jgi:hypothetical protein
LPFIYLFSFDFFNIYLCTNAFEQTKVSYLITPYISVLDIDWLITGVFLYFEWISYNFSTAWGWVFAWGFHFLPYGRVICQNIFALFYPIEPQFAKIIHSLFCLVLCNMVSWDLTCRDISNGSKWEMWF